jgi:quercetin dioxygenase-like cupin family protein
MSDVRDLLPLYALGVLAPDEVSQVDQAIAADPRLAAELASYQDGATALVAPIPPAPEVEARLLASIGGGRFEAYSSRMAKLFDVTVDRAREILGLIERRASWDVAAPGVGLVHFTAGPAFAAADCGFVRLEPGAAFPFHRHMGEEVSLILAGRLRDRATGRVYAPGDEVLEPEANDHDVICEGDEACLYAARVMNGIEIAGSPARPPGK